MLLTCLVLGEDRQHKPGLLVCRDLVLTVQVAVFRQHLHATKPPRLQCKKMRADKLRCTNKGSLRMPFTQQGNAEVSGGEDSWR